MVDLRPTGMMSDAELLAEADVLDRLEDLEARTDPARLLRRLRGRRYRIRAHLRVLSAAVARVEDPDPSRRVDRVLIREPPQTGKTVTAVVGGAFWQLSRHPTRRVIVGSYNDNLAQDRGREVKQLVADYGARFGLHLAYGTQAVADWRLTSGGGVKSVGIGTGIAGFPGDIAFIDDPHKSRQEADSLRMRERAYRWLSADIISRLSPGAAVIITMTPWHPDDLSARVLADEGRLEDGGRWLVVDMPALCRNPVSDPLGRAVGQPLPHPKVPAWDTKAALAHWMDKRRSSTSRDWAALYQLDAQPEEGALLSRRLLRERRCFAEGSGPCCTEVRIAAVAVDPSGGGRDTAGVVGGWLGTDGRLYLAHDRTDVMGSDEWARRACQLAVDLDADRIVYETNFGGDMVTLSIRTAWDLLRREELDKLGGDPDAAGYLGRARYGRLCPRLVGVRARKSKLLRAEPIAQQWIEDRIRTAAYLPELEEEWATWQPDHHQSPGRIDASVYLAYALLKPPSPGGGQARAQPSGPMSASQVSPLDRGRSVQGEGFSSNPLGPLG